MNHNYIKVIACVLLSISGYSLTIAQSTDPEFIDCSSIPDTLCVEDEGVRLPANNQLFLGEEDPEASSCSVHVTQKKRVRSHCGSTLQYEVLLFIHDTSSVYILKSVSTVTTDSLGEAELTFNTEEAVDSVIRTSGIPYGADCSNPHLIKWVVLDSCGGFSVCEQRIDLYDCVAPDISSISPGTYSFTNSAYINIYGEDLVFIQDDCTLWEDFQISFDSLSYQPIKEFYFCDIPAFEVELPYTIWIADHGKDINCDGEIVWNERNIEKREVKIVFTDNTVTIGCYKDILVAGEVRTEYIQGIKDVEVEFSTPGQVYPTYITGPDGKYAFYTVLINGEATITAFRNDFHRNGVSTLDLVRIQKHLLGKDSLDSPYEIIAADANNSQNVSAIDLIEIRKLILGIYTEFPQNLSWRFVPADYVFPDPLDPWTDTIAPWPQNGSGIITITDPANPGNLDFIGIKIGDVNGTAQPNFTQLLPRASLPGFKFITEQQSFKAGDVIHVDFRMSSDELLTGFQFTVATTGMEILDIIPGKILVRDEHYAILADKMTISWFDANELAIKKDEVLFTLQLRAKNSGTLSQSLAINSDITDAEIYLDGEQTLLPVLAFQNQEAHQLEILSCFPNPWKDHTSIQFYLPESGFVTVALFDATGRRIQTTSELLQKGYHQHEISSSDFPDRGLVFVEISTTESKVFQKMIVLE